MRTRTVFFGKIAILFLFLPLSVIHSYIDLWVQPGVNWYSDGCGWNIDAGIRADIRQLVPSFPDGLFVGLNAHFSCASTALSNLRIVGLSGGPEIGFDFLRTSRRWALAPSVTVGAGWLDLANAYTNTQRIGLFVSPALRFSFPLLSFVMVGTDVSYRMQFVDLLTNSYTHQTLNASLSLTFILADNRPSVREPTDINRGSLAENVRAVVREQNLPGTVTEESGGVTLSISDVLFDVNSDGVRSEFGESLAALARRVGTYPNLVISVEGHTDDTGNADYNRALSGRRARNVAVILVRWGIPEGRISTAGYGQERPAAPNTSPANRARNRRVEIRFREGR